MKQLKQLGLTEYEVQVYLALLKYGSLKGGELSKLSSVPHGKTYQALESLQSKGFVSVLPVKPKVFSAVKPEIAIVTYSNIKINNLKNLEQDLIKNLKKVPKPINKSKVADKFTIIHGFKNERQLSKHTYDIAKKYVKNMSTYETVSSYARAEAQKRGVKIFQIATKSIKKKEKGVKLKHYPLEELRLKVIDGNKSVMTIVNPDNTKDRVAVFIESKELSEAFEDYFDKIWKKAKQC